MVKTIKMIVIDKKTSRRDKNGQRINNLATDRDIIRRNLL